jgi:hypothetical protein
MRTYTLAALGLALVFGAGVLRGDPEPKDRDRVAALIRQLGDDQFTRRERASKELAALGEHALANLDAAISSPDAEVRRRAEVLLRQIRHRLAHTDVKHVPPPGGAVVLFNGENLNGWVARDGAAWAPWRLLAGGVMEAAGTDIRTRKTFAGSYKLHVEFRVPHMPKATAQGRGNSGVYLHGRYEVQILDSFGLKGGDGDCGAIYGVAAPRVNACKAPEKWQSFDIEFHPPRFTNGVKSRLAQLTVRHNGVLIHDREELSTDDTGLGLADHPSLPGPVLLQYHGSPVHFRNIWLLPLAKR